MEEASNRTLMGRKRSGSASMLSTAKSCCASVATIEAGHSPVLPSSYSTPTTVLCGACQACTEARQEGAR